MGRCPHRPGPSWGRPVRTGLGSKAVLPETPGYHVCTCAHTEIHTCTCTRTLIQTRRHTHTHTDTPREHICAHAYTHTDRHTHRHTRIHPELGKPAAAVGGGLSVGMVPPYPSLGTGRFSRELPRHLALFWPLPGWALETGSAAGESHFPALSISWPCNGEYRGVTGSSVCRGHQVGSRPPHSCPPGASACGLLGDAALQMQSVKMERSPTGVGRLGPGPYEVTSTDAPRRQPRARDAAASHANKDVRLEEAGPASSRASGGRAATASIRGLPASGSAEESGPLFSVAWFVLIC